MVEAIWLIEDAQQFDKIAKAMACLDALVSGADFYGNDMTSEEMSTLKAVCDYFLARGKKKKQHDFIYSTFRCYVQHKVSIRLMFANIFGYKRELLDLFMHPFDDHKNIWKRDEGDFRNLFRPELLQIFTNVKTITIGTKGLPGDWSLSLLSLLSLIESSTVQKVIISGGSWLDLLWKSPSKMLIQQRYNEKKYDIKVEQNGVDSLGATLYQCDIQKRL